jgi:hypothetical protein
VDLLPASPVGVGAHQLQNGSVGEHASDVLGSAKRAREMGHEAVRDDNSLELHSMELFVPCVHMLLPDPGVEHLPNGAVNEAKDGRHESTVCIERSGICGEGRGGEDSMDIPGEEMALLFVDELRGVIGDG